MIKKYPAIICLMVIILFTQTGLYAQTKKDSLFAGVERIDPAFDAMITNKFSFEVAGEGFDWCEGPVWVADKEMLLFSDIPKNTVYKWTPKKGIEVYLKPSGYTSTKPRGGEMGSNGLLLNKKGQLILAQDGDRRVALMNAPIQAPKPNFITLANNYKGKRFDSPNDMALRSNGDIYFTDPPYGLEFYIDDTAKDAPYQGVYKLAVDGTVTLLTDTINRPNGIGILPGDTTILISNSESEKAIWYAYDLDKNGLFTNPHIFYDASAIAMEKGGGPDGFKVDSKGNVYSSGPEGIWIFDKTGKVLGKIKINGRVSNCALAYNETVLFVTADDYLLKIRLR
ncbi:SMP-30/gluconolactonase/LRE family protein [Limnovirga soli]|uniref:SMP-30/gluconolactonase/LRE family protein n=1 Tax=Limnovirga soli TaxID=2656915 RepID=A0A8J8JTA9_9BACT|nr:SMP-30/gluconolactonase/LRE family protein [Limnovirga soli]NNV54439.1 SMP-30/gluconolactonase/LRE family protein [Limnovirga soli]